MSNETNPNQILIKVWDIPTSPPLYIEFEWKLGSDSKYHGTCKVKEPIPVAFPTTYLYGQKFTFSWGYLDSCGFRIRWCFNENGLKDWDPITSYQEGIDEVERFIKEIGYGYILEYQNEKIDEMADLFQGKKKACFTLHLDPPLEIEVIDRATKNNKYPIVYIREDEGLKNLSTVELSPIFIGEQLTPDWGYPDPNKGNPYDNWDIFRCRAIWRGRVWFGLFDGCIKDIDKWLATYFPSIPISQTIIDSGNIHILDNSSVVSSPAAKKEEETKPKLDLLKDNVERINDKVDYSSLLARKTLTDNQTLPRKMTFEERVISRLDELKERMDRLERIILPK